MTTKKIRTRPDHRVSTNLVGIDDPTMDMIREQNFDLTEPRFQSFEIALGAEVTECS